MAKKADSAISGLPEGQEMLCNPAQAADAFENIQKQDDYSHNGSKLSHGIRSADIPAA